MVNLGWEEGSKVGNRIYLSPLQSNIRLLFERVNKLLKQNEVRITAQPHKQQFR